MIGICHSQGTQQVQTFAPQSCGAVLRVLVLVLASVPDPGIGQSAGSIGTMSCYTCRIQFERIATLGAPSGPLALTEDAIFAIRPGVVAIAGRHNPGVVDLFTHEGAQLGSFGSYGEGPGEFRVITGLEWLADTLFVLDPLLGRVSWFSSGRHRGSYSVPRGTRRIMPMGGGRIAIASPTTAGLADRTYLQIISGGRVERAFVGPVGSDWDSGRVLTPMPEGLILSSPIGAYRLEVWSQTGELQDLGLAERVWFKNGTPAGHAARTPPPAQVRTIYSEPEVGIWVVATVADRNWTPQELLPTATGEFRSPRAGHDRLYDSIVELVSQDGWTVRAMAVSDRKLMPAGNGYVYSYEESETGVPIYALWRLRVIGGTWE